MPDKTLLSVLDRRERERASTVLMIPGTELPLAPGETTWAKTPKEPPVAAKRSNDKPERKYKPVTKDGKMYCPINGCGRRLRGDNERGICATCYKQPGMRSRNGLPIGTTFITDLEHNEVSKETKAEIVKRTSAGYQRIRSQFYGLAAALELDAEDLVMQFMESWLKTTRAKALREDENGKDDDVLGAMARPDLSKLIDEDEDKDEP